MWKSQFPRLLGILLYCNTTWLHVTLLKGQDCEDGEQAGCWGLEFRRGWGGGERTVRSGKGSSSGVMEFCTLTVVVIQPKHVITQHRTTLHRSPVNSISIVPMLFSGFAVALQEVGVPFGGYWAEGWRHSPYYFWNFSFYYFKIKSFFFIKAMHFIKLMIVIISNKIKFLVICYCLEKSTQHTWYVRDTSENFWKTKSMWNTLKFIWESTGVGVGHIGEFCSHASRCHNSGKQKGLCSRW